MASTDEMNQEFASTSPKAMVHERGGAKKEPVHTRKGRQHHRSAMRTPLHFREYEKQERMSSEAHVGWTTALSCYYMMSCHRRECGRADPPSGVMYSHRKSLTGSGLHKLRGLHVPTDYCIQESILRIRVSGKFGLPLILHWI